MTSSSSSSSLASTQLPEGTNVAFHLNPRFVGSSGEAANYVVMNSRFASEWGDEQRELNNFPFELGKAFKLMILVEADGFKVAVNGKHMWTFAHRCDYKDIGRYSFGRFWSTYSNIFSQTVRMHIEGHLSVELIEFRRELKYVKRETFSSASASGGDEASAEAVQVEVKAVHTPDIPYREYDSRLGSPAYNIYISGRLPNVSAKAFVVNLGASGNLGVIKTLPFHLSIRPDEKLMVRNSRADEAWAEEERALLTSGGVFPLEPGTAFDMLISKNQSKILVAVNGQLAFEYAHRLDPKMIDTLEITGCVEVASVRYEFL